MLGSKPRNHDAPYFGVDLAEEYPQEVEFLRSQVTPEVLFKISKSGSVVKKTEYFRDIGDEDSYKYGDDLSAYSIFHKIVGGRDPEERYFEEHWKHYEYRMVDGKKVTYNTFPYSEEFYDFKDKALTTGWDIKAMKKEFIAKHKGEIAQAKAKHQAEQATKQKQPKRDDGRLLKGATEKSFKELVKKMSRPDGSHAEHAVKLQLAVWANKHLGTTDPKIVERLLTRAFYAQDRYDRMWTLTRSLLMKAGMDFLKTDTTPTMKRHKDYLDLVRMTYGRFKCPTADVRDWQKQLLKQAQLVIPHIIYVSADHGKRGTTVSFLFDHKDMPAVQEQLGVSPI